MTLVTFFDAHDELALTLARALLDKAGIPYVVTGEELDCPCTGLRM
jgi:hypothetical protein